MPTTEGSAPGFAPVTAGSFFMGADDGPHPEDGEGPQRRVRLSAFSIRATAVTTAQFSGFVEATGYVTLAEQRGNSQVFQGQLQTPGDHPVASSAAPWWRMCVWWRTRKTMP